MKFSKSTFLPILGMTALALFILISYVYETVFLDQILICSFILSILFIAKMRDGAHQIIDNRDNPKERNLSK